VELSAKAEASEGGEGMNTILVLLFATLRAATPLLLAALGGIFSERSGVVNIALEGIILMGAWAAVYFAWLTGNPWMGVLGAIIVGLAVAGIHAVVSIHYRANQVVSGVAINLLAAGFTEFMVTRLTQVTWEDVKKIPNIFGLNPFVYVSLILVAVSHFMLYRTAWGLRLRAVGEHPKAADTVGISVPRMRYWGVLLSGVLGGLAGASLSVGLLSRFTLGMSSGRGFIALGAVIFGRWNPVGALWACLLFGVADALQTMVQMAGIHIPSQFLAMAPYIITMLALVGLVGRSRAPAASGTPYDKAH
jgi:ABC-type uncharacterized transport system permease subunit